MTKEQITLILMVGTGLLPLVSLGMNFQVILIIMVLIGIFFLALRE